jgi:cytochrome c biogenesis factor
VATVAASLVFIIFGFPSVFPVVNAVLPLLFVAAITATVGVLMAIVKNRSVALTGRQIMHLGVIVVLFGVFVSSSMSPDPQSVTVGVSSAPASVLGVDLSVVNVTMGLGSGSAYVSEIDMVAPEQSSMSVPFKVSYAGRIYSGVLTGQYFPNYGLVAHPTVLGDGVTDIYVNLNLDQTAYNSLFSALIGMNNPPSTLTLQLSTKPLVNVIWWGSALMSLGIIISMPSTLSEGKKKASKPIEEHKRDGDDRDQN